MRTVRLPDDGDLDNAWDVVRRHLAPTPLRACELAGWSAAWLKVETFQPTGSFKVRGALSAVSALPPHARAVTASAGNHALGMAYASAVTGARVTVVVPENASPAKVAALRGFPVDLVQHGIGYEAAEAHALTLAEADGQYISAYNDPLVIAGQSTIGRELDDAPALGNGERAGPLTVVTPVGGGGLMAGLALWARRRGDVRVVGVEAKASLAVSAAVRSGRIEPVEVGDTIADGLAGSLEPGSITPGLLGPESVLVSVTEDELGQAMRWLFARHGLVVEGSGAAALAAVLAGKLDVADPGRGGPDRAGPDRAGQLVVLLTGRNITPGQFAGILTDQATSPR